MTWADMCPAQVSTTRRPLPRTDDSEGTVTPRSVSTEQWVWCLIHMWSMLRVISVIRLVHGPPHTYLMCIMLRVISVIRLVHGPPHTLFNVH
jgi:hypothetical protein